MSDRLALSPSLHVYQCELRTFCLGLDSNQMLADVTNEVVAAIRTFAQSRTSGEALTTPGRGDT